MKCCPSEGKMTSEGKKQATITHKCEHFKFQIHSFISLGWLLLYKNGCWIWTFFIDFRGQIIKSGQVNLELDECSHSCANITQCMSVIWDRHRLSKTVWKSRFLVVAHLLIKHKYFIQKELIRRNEFNCNIQDSFNSKHRHSHQITHVHAHIWWNIFACTQCISFLANFSFLTHKLQRNLGAHENLFDRIWINTFFRFVLI